MPKATSEARGAKAAGRPRVAFLAAHLDDEYEWVIWRGVRRAVEERGGSVVCFAGAGLADPDLDRRARTRLFELVHASSVDAVLCLSSVLGQYVGVPGIEKWLLERGILSVSIGPAEHIPSVTVDDSTGVTQLMRHLITHHRHRRIAFVTGNPSNAEAQRRLSAYIQVLSDHRLSFDPRLTLTGDFTAESGARAVAELFDTRGIPTDALDAVVCSNDYMAFGVIEELARRGISVPDQVAVVGFDDVAPARVHQPSLTTVRQPLEELGRRGALRLLNLLDGAAAEGALTLDTELVLRRSCGCLPTEVPVRLEGPEDTPVSSIGRPLRGITLETALAAELEGAHGSFARALEPYLRRLASGNAEELEHGRRFADDLATRVRLAREDLVHRRLSRLARVLHQRMFGPKSQICAALAELMPEFGIDECAVSEFVPRAPGNASVELELAFGFDAEDRAPEPVTFDARQLVPAAFEGLRTRSCLVLPLTLGAETLGIVVVPASGRDGAFYEVLAELFSTILKVQELRRKANDG